MYKAESCRIQNMPSQGTILCLNADADDPTKRLKLAGMRRFAAAAGWRVVPVAQRRSRRDGIPALLDEYRPAGCIYDEDGTPLPVSMRNFGGIPVAFANGTRSRFDAVADRVCGDSGAVARAAFRELSAGKPEAFAVVGNFAPRQWSDVRVREFLSLVAESGRPGFALRSRSGEGSEGFARRLARWIVRLPRHTAVYAVNDRIAARVAAAALSAGMRLPHDITLLGTDNETAVCEGMRPGLSSIQMDFERMGYLAMRLLDERIRGVRTAPAVEKVGPLLAVRRESTRGGGRREPHVMEAVEIIRREACDGLTVARLAARLPGSRRLLDLRFREAMGHSILDEILYVRLERVMDLLRRPETPIGAIADFCGFGTMRDLDKLFRKRFGSSMRTWRKLHARP